MSHTPIRSFSTAPLQPVSGQFPILKAAALACLPSSTSVPKRMLHVLLPYQFTLVLHNTSSTRLRTVPHFESSCPRLPVFRYLCPEKNAPTSSIAPLQPVSGQFPILKAAALACLSLGTSVPKIMLHVFSHQHLAPHVGRPRTNLDCLP